MDIKHYDDDDAADADDDDADDDDDDDDVLELSVVLIQYRSASATDGRTDGYLYCSNTSTYMPCYATASVKHTQDIKVN